MYGSPDLASVFLVTGVGCASCSGVTECKCLPLLHRVEEARLARVDQELENNLLMKIVFTGGQRDSTVNDGLARAQPTINPGTPEGPMSSARSDT